MTNLDSIFKSRDITLLTKSRLVKAMVFQWSCMDVGVGLWRKLSAEELMFLNSGVGKDSWESLGLQGDPTSPFWRRSALGFLWKDWCQSWNSSTLATSCKDLTHWKTSWCWEGLGAGEEGDDRWWDGWWHHWLDGCESEWTPGAGDEQGGLECCDSWGLYYCPTNRSVCTIFLDSVCMW